MYEVQSGDTLTSIAQRFYGSGAKYPLIENANPGLDSYSLRIGKKSGFRQQLVKQLR